MSMSMSMSIADETDHENSDRVIRNIEIEKCDILRSRLRSDSIPSDFAKYM